MKSNGDVIDRQACIKSWDDCNFVRHLSEKYGLGFECVKSIFDTLKTDLTVYKNHRQHVEEFVQLYLEGRDAV